MEYASITCPHCTAFNNNVKPQLKAEYIDTNLVRFVFREFPTPPVDLAMADRAERGERLAMLRQRLWSGLEALGGVRLNGHPERRLAHNLNITIDGVEGGRLHRLLRRELAVSSGSACSQGSPSHVLAALGRSPAEAAASIRFGLGRGTSEAEIDQAIHAVAAALAELRRGP